MHVMQADGVSVVFDLFREGIGQSGEPPHAHSHREILPLDIACRDMVRVWVASAAVRLSPVNLRWTVPPGRMRNFAVKLDELSVIDIGPKASLNGFQVGAVSVTGYLDAISKTTREIADKFNSSRSAPIADAPRRDEFRISADRNPRPNIASCLWRSLGKHDVALLGVDEAPNLVELDALAWQIAKRLVLIGRTRLTGIDCQLVNGIDRNVGNAARCAKAGAFNQQIED